MTTASPTKDILFIQTGGTIDKEYPKTIGGYSFEIGDPAIERVVGRVKPSVGFSYTTVTICQKDSQEILQRDREVLAKCIGESIQKKIIVTHGTDTIIETALFVQNHLSKTLTGNNKNVIFVGSFIPEKFKDSDADINIGAALGALDVLGMLRDDKSDKPDDSRCVYISLGGRVIPADKAVRNTITGLFCHCDEIDISGEVK